MTKGKGLWSFRDLGDATAPAVVLLHSIATNGEMWTAQCGPWARRHRLIVVDLPGHGATPVDPAVQTLEDHADGLERLLNHLELPTATLVGLSLGGMIAQTFAVRFGARTRALVIANSLARVNAAAVAAWDARRQQVAASGMQSQISDTLARWFTPAFAAASPLTLDWIASMLRSTPVEGYCAAAGAIQKLDLLERLTGIECPALVITGDADAMASPGVAKEMADRLPKGELCVLDAAAHLSNVERPVAFCEAVGAFLNRTTGVLS